MRADLHIHSLFSDGTDTIDEIVAKARDGGLNLISITDHDYLSDVSALSSEEVKCVAGVELSCTHKYEVHILGLCMKDVANLQRELLYLREQRAERAQEITKKLNKLGLDISYEEVCSFSKGESVGRLHVARALVERRFCASVEEAFALYLSKGKSGYVERAKLLPSRAIELIQDGGGLSFLAHPFVIEETVLPRMIDEFREAGLCGIEAYYPLHANKQVAYYEQLAKVRGMLVSIGSDYHGQNKGQKLGCEQRDSEYLQQCLQEIG